MLGLDAAQLRAGYAEKNISPMEVTKAVLAAAALARDTYAAVTSINQTKPRQHHKSLLLPFLRKEVLSRSNLFASYRDGSSR